MQAREAKAIAETCSEHKLLQWNALYEYMKMVVMSHLRSWLSSTSFILI